SETIFSSSHIDELTVPLEKGQSLNKSDAVLVESANLDLSYWGSNEKNVVFLIRSSAVDYFSPEAEDAFLKTIAALKLTINDVSIVNLAKTSTSFDDVKKVLNPRFCIYCEGEGKAKQGRFNTLFVEGGLTFLYTYSFEEMLRDVNMKRAFWNAIKEIKVS